MMNDFTKGEWRLYVTKNPYFRNGTPLMEIEVDGDTIMSNEPYYPWNSENEHDWYLFATAGTTATKLAEAGYDAVKVFEVLPDIMQAMVYIDEANVCETTSTLLKQCRSE